MVGQTCRSMCEIISAVPSLWLTCGHAFGLYIESVMSRISTTFTPFLASWRRPNGRPSTHMLVCTPTRITFLMLPACKMFQTFVTLVADEVPVVVDRQSVMLPGPRCLGVEPFRDELLLPLSVFLRRVVLTAIGLIQRVLHRLFRWNRVAPSVDFLLGALFSVRLKLAAARHGLCTNRRNCLVHGSR